MKSKNCTTGETILESNTNNDDEQFWVMDGRANYEIDDAQVLLTCGTLKEAKRSVHDFGNDTCIVKVVINDEGYTFELVYSLFWEDEV